jgi:hypothetical protein
LGVLLPDETINNDAARNALTTAPPTTTTTATTSATNETIDIDATSDDDNNNNDDDDDDDNNNNTLYLDQPPPTQLTQRWPAYVVVVVDAVARERDQRAVHDVVALGSSTARRVAARRLVLWFFVCVLVVFW